MKTTNAPAVEWPPSGASSSTRTASQGKASTDFGALLDTHQARTATAEGPKKHKSPEKTEARQAKPAEKPDAPVHEQPEPKPVDAQRPEAKPATGGEQQPAEGQQPQADQPTVETPAVVNEPVVEFVPAPVIAEVAKPQTGEQAAALATTAAAQQAAGGEQVAVQAPVAPQQPQQQQQAGETAEAAVPVAAQATEAKAQQPQQQPQATAPVVADEQPADAAPEPTVTRADKPAQPQGQQQAQAQQQPTGDQPRQQPQSDQRPAEQSRPVTTEQPVQQRTAAPEARTERPQAQPVQQAPSAPVSAPSAPQPTRTDAPTRAVPLSRAADAVENVIRLGSQRGVTHARLSLKPADLGGVEIRLQQTSTGLTASVVADGAEAAQMLQQAGAELRQKLEAHGIQLQSLDISYSGDEKRDARSAAAQTGDGEQRSSTGDTSSTATDGGELTPTEEISVKETLELPDGVLVDVLA